MPLLRIILARATLLALIATPPAIIVATKVGAAPQTREQAVSIKGFAFVPQVITVTPGTPIVWTNADEDPHTVTANDKSFHSAALDTGDKYRFIFTRPGVYAYFCSLHPHMTGKILVKG